MKLARARVTRCIARRQSDPLPVGDSLMRLFPVQSPSFVGSVITVSVCASSWMVSVSGWTTAPRHVGLRPSLTCHSVQRIDRRAFVATTAAGIVASSVAGPSVEPAYAIGPVRIDLEPLSYSAKLCPPEKPMPGQQAMKGMRPLCVTVEAILKDTPSKQLEKAGVYGFVKNANTGDSVLANNPDLSTDAGQFAMIERITPTDKKVVFEFIAAVPQEEDISKYERGIGPLEFEGIRVISFPGGQQYGAISPCEMNEFSDECEAWETENGPFKRGEYMMQRNPRSAGK